MDIGNSITMHGVRPPGSGMILGYILNILKRYGISPSEEETPLLVHRIVEAFKWGYGARTEMGDPWDVEIHDFMTEVWRVMSSISYYSYLLSLFAAYS